MMASPFVGPVSAIQVGSCFVEQYYYILQRNPKLVYQFYTDASTMLRIDGDRNEVASAMLQIHSLVMSLNFSGIEIKTTHSLDSWSGGVLVTVTGYVQITSFSGRRKFVETFFLAPQEKGYFVLNDVFHLLDEEQIPPHPMSMLTSSTFESPLIASNPLSERDYILGGELKAREYIVSPHVEENNMVENYSKPESQQVLEADNRVAEETDAEDSSASYPVAGNNTRDVASVAAQEPVGEVPKQTYASILRIFKNQQVAPVATQASSNKSVPVSSEWHSAQSHQQSLPEPAIAHDKHGVETVEETATPEEEGEGRSVYVRNLPSTVSASDIELEFNSFGRIRPEGVVVRNRKDLGICYAFVEFEDVLGVQSAVNASPIQFAGRQVHIEERRANTNAPRGGRRGRGRGRFQSEAPRGRISGRNFGRGSWQDGERDYNNRLRVDVRGPRQDRGILGNHISKTSSHHSEDAA